MHGGGGHREGYWSWGIEGSDSADPMHVPAPAGGGMGGEREGGHRRVNEKWEAGREEGCEKGSREVEGSSVRCNRGRLVREDLAMERRTADRDKQFLSGLGLTRRGAAAALLLVALVFASSADALNCYVHQKSGGLIKGTDPTNSQDCGTVLDYNPLAERDASALRTDEQILAMQPTCFRSCQGETEASARCTYSCTRWSACQMMQKTADDLNLREVRNTDTTLFNACLLFPKLCPKKYFSHSCCVVDVNCNRNAASRAVPISYGWALASAAFAWGAAAMSVV